MATIESIEGIGKKYGKILAKHNIKTTNALLKAGGTRKGRADLAKECKISPKLVLEWVNRADLFRVKGIGEEYSDLLEAAGVDSVVELSKRKPANLHEKMLEVNAKKKLVRRNCGLGMVEKWVAHAKELPRAVSH